MGPLFDYVHRLIAPLLDLTGLIDPLRQLYVAWVVGPEVRMTLASGFDSQTSPDKYKAGEGCLAVHDC